jgi:putative DNA methylase
MILKDCKRLAEVDFPIADASRHAAREKSIRHGHPSTLHLWWARRPLASSRAVLLALLWPDPCDPLCPTEFKVKARKLLPQVGGCNPGTTQEDLRKALFKFIADFGNWDLAANRRYIEVARALIKAAHGEQPPLVVDPFAGGGSIPLEALRLGCEAFASDLNPVACLILKVMLEEIPHHGPEFAEKLRKIGADIKVQAEKELAEFYPPDPDGAQPIAYLWARTVRCEEPRCGAEIPLTRSFWLCKKPGRRRAIRIKINRRHGASPEVQYEIYEPSSEKDIQSPTISQAKAVCPACQATLRPERVQAQLASKKGGSNPEFASSGKRISGALLLAVVTIRKGDVGRAYRLPTSDDYRAVAKAMQAHRLKNVPNPAATLPNPFPDEPLPTPAGKRFKEDGLSYKFFPLVRYGLESWGDFFTVRQQIALRLLTEKIAEKSAEYPALLLALGKLVDLANIVCPWEPQAECPRNVLSNGRVKPSWSFAEGVPTGEASASFEKCLENLCSGVVASYVGTRKASIQQSRAQQSPLPHESASVWFTDPPYYDAIPYSSLSNAFWVWIRRASRFPFVDQLETEQSGVSPIKCEIIDDLELLRGHKKERAKADGIPVKDRDFFEENMAQAFAAGRAVLKDGGIASVVFAHKTTEGWEALISGMINGGFEITASWPIATEMAHRLRARESAALGTSVHLICRPRPDDAGVGDWAIVLRELPKRVGDWMERLQGEGVRGADLVFACIGPALEIFSQYAKVETAEGREVALAEYLEKVWEVVGRSALAQVLGTAEAGAVEEDARLTALFLWTLQSTNGGPHPDPLPEGEGEEAAEDEEGAPHGAAKGYTLVFDVVRRFAQPLGIQLPKWEGRVIETKKGVVRLLPIAERAKQLFGEDGAQAVAARLEREATTGQIVQLELFPNIERGVALAIRGRGRGKRATIEVSDESLQAAREATTLDRVHAAMLLQAGGRTNALRALLKAEQERGPDFLRLANALSALYPQGSEEKRLLDAMLLAAPR